MLAAAAQVKRGKQQAQKADNLRCHPGYPHLASDRSDTPRVMFDNMEPDLIHIDHDHQPTTTAHLDIVVRRVMPDVAMDEPFAAF